MRPSLFIRPKSRSSDQSGRSWSAAIAAISRSPTPNRGKQLERLAQRHVDRAEPAADRGGARRTRSAPRRPATPAEPRQSPPDRCRRPVSRPPCRSFASSVAFVRWVSAGAYLRWENGSYPARTGTSSPQRRLLRQITRRIAWATDPRRPRAAASCPGCPPHPNAPRSCRRRAGRCGSRASPPSCRWRRCPEVALMGPGGDLAHHDLVALRDHVLLADRQVGEGVSEHGGQLLETGLAWRQVGRWCVVDVVIGDELVEAVEISFDEQLLDETFHRGLVGVGQRLSLLRDVC